MLHHGLGIFVNDAAQVLVEVVQRLYMVETGTADITLFVVLEKAVVTDGKIVISLPFQPAFRLPFVGNNQPVPFQLFYLLFISKINLFAHFPFTHNASRRFQKNGSLINEAPAVSAKSRAFPENPSVSLSYHEFCLLSIPAGKFSPFSFCGPLSLNAFNSFKERSARTKYVSPAARYAHPCRLLPSSMHSSDLFLPTPRKRCSILRLPKFSPCPACSRSIFRQSAPPATFSRRRGR